MENKKNKIIQLATTWGIMFMAIATLFTPIYISGRVVSLPFQFIFGKYSDELFGSYNYYVSFNIIKYYSILATLLCVLSCFYIGYLMLTKSKKFIGKTNLVSTIVLVSILITVLIGINLMNIANQLRRSSVISLSVIPFVLALVLYIVKRVFAYKLDESTSLSARVQSNTSLIMTFVVTALSISTLAVPIYIFPGTSSRAMGIDLLLGSKHAFSTLKMNTLYMILMILFIVGILSLFIASIVTYSTKRKAFIYINRINIGFGVFVIVAYMFMGFGYLITYVDASLYSMVPASSMNTYSYIPLVLFGLFWLGYAFTKLTMDHSNVEYKIVASGDGFGGGNAGNSRAGFGGGAGGQIDNSTVGTTAMASPATAGAVSSAGTQTGSSVVDIASVPLIAIEDETTKKFNDMLADPIPAFSELDNKLEKFAEDLENRRQHNFDEPSLPKLVNHIIMYAKYSRENLSYTPQQIKSFIAGLSASRLAILQGLSGTGKTSLPKIFMEAIDGECKLVAIESSWRDKNELLGYYNQFNKKYTPKIFTQHLYLASLNPEIPYFIVLDEMNLSRIEYYFSDFLSLMEEREEDRNIKLYDVQLFPSIDERTKYLSLRDGHTLDIPTNVWFIGTANRDESTFEISDKVYDRAQTMNFRKRATKAIINGDAEVNQKFVTAEQLQELFEKAQSIEFNAETYPEIAKVEELLRPYKITFGNRVLKQMETFVKTYVACSKNNETELAKNIHEAVDAILYSKVVCKLEYKQLVELDQLIEEFDELKLPQCVDFLKGLAIEQW